MKRLYCVFRHNRAPKLFRLHTYMSENMEMSNELEVQDIGRFGASGCYMASNDDRIGGFVES